MKDGICKSPMLQIVSQTATGQIYTTSLFKKWVRKWVILEYFVSNVLVFNDKLDSKNYCVWAQANEVVHGFSQKQCKIIYCC